MELDVKLGGDSLSIPISNPFQLDMPSMMEKIESFATAKGIKLDSLDIAGLIPKMVKGIAGCERGCPADAKGLVSRGVNDFELEYIEGGILSANAKTAGGAPVQIKMFPDF
ncbi:MAG: hypothetical protein OEW04_10980 [Nitrospirota bacterium]|nr:hypothetical protein [Nitrospirota bacterium]